MSREWKCVLAGGAHHGTVVSRAAHAASPFPPAVTMDDGLYLPMTMTSLVHAGVEEGGACVLAHSHASLQEVHEAHLMLMQMRPQPVPADGNLDGSSRAADSEPVEA